MYPDGATMRDLCAVHACGAMLCAAFHQMRELLLAHAEACWQPPGWGAAGSGGGTGGDGRRRGRRAPPPVGGPGPVGEGLAERPAVPRVLARAVGARAVAEARLPPELDGEGGGHAFERTPHTAMHPVPAYGLGGGGTSLAASARSSGPGNGSTAPRARGVSSSSGGPSMAALAARLPPLPPGAGPGPPRESSGGAGGRGTPRESWSGAGGAPGASPAGGGGGGAHAVGGGASSPAQGQPKVQVCMSAPAQTV
jgi:hypothetical protein